MDADDVEPVTGCTKVSQGCKNCFAQRMAKRLHAMGTERYRNGFAVTMHEDLVDLPRSWKKLRLVFRQLHERLVSSHCAARFYPAHFPRDAGVPSAYVQVLTKRSERLVEVAPQLVWPANVWMGVSVENSDVVSRIEHLQQVPAHVRFLSVEPLIGPIADMPLDGIHWVIVGGESGPGARPHAREWVGKYPYPMHRSECTVLFQTMGRRSQRPHRPRTVRANL